MVRRPTGLMYTAKWRIPPAASVLATRYPCGRAACDACNRVSAIGRYVGKQLHLRQVYVRPAGGIDIQPAKGHGL